MLSVGVIMGHTLGVCAEDMWVCLSKCLLSVFTVCFVFVLLCLGL